MLVKASIGSTRKACCLYQQIRHATIIKKHSRVSPKTHTIRREQGLPANHNAAGVLTDSPDYSYLDGRITPLGVGQRKRLLINEESKLKIIALTREIDFAVEQYKKLQDEQMAERQRVLDSKLKPKGAALLESQKM